MKLSFIVSTFERPLALSLCLRSIALQTFKGFECLVTDNTVDTHLALAARRAVEELMDPRFQYVETCQENCYLSADLGVSRAGGEFVCFPSDDNYYVPGYAEVMLATAEATGADLVACDMLYDPRLKGVYAAHDVEPMVGHIDKGGFMVRRSVFMKVGWPRPINYPICDGLFIEELMRREVSYAKAPGVLWVHN